MPRPGEEESLEEEGIEARREFDARMGALPRGKVVKKPVVTKLWVNGRATEDREEWSEEVRAHCEKCYDDKSETPEVQAKESGNRDAEVTAWLLFKVGECRLQSTGYYGHVGRCYEVNLMARPIAWWWRC